MLVAGLAAAPASATTLGPVYPVPTWHGGNQCQAASSLDGQAGKGGGQTWSYGGGGATPTASATDCDGSSAPPAFDTTLFQNLYWGIDKNSPPKLAMDGAYDTAGETMSLSTAPGDTDLSAGRLVWTGSTEMSGCQPAPCSSFSVIPVDTKLVLTITNTTGGGSSPAALTDPNTAGIASLGQLGGVVSVTPTLTNFAANFLFMARVTGGGSFGPALDFYNSYNHPTTTQLAMSSFSGAFYYVTRPPNADFSCTPAAPVVGDTITCTASDSDPDGQPGAPLDEKWDWNGNGSTSDPEDKSGHQVSGTFAEGAHTVTLHVLDNEGGDGTATKQITVGAAPTNTSGGSGGTGGAGGAGGTGAPAPGGGTSTADTTAPKATLALAKTKLKALLKKGLAGSLTSNEAGVGKLSLTIPVKIAKKLKLKGPVGKVTVTITAAGKKAFKIKLSKKAAKKLAKLKSVKFKVSGPVTDAAGNRTVVSKSTTVKR